MTAFGLCLVGGVLAAAAGEVWGVVVAACCLLALVYIEGRHKRRRRANEATERRIRLRESAWRATERYR